MTVLTQNPVTRQFQPNLGIFGTLSDIAGVIPGIGGTVSRVLDIGERIFGGRQAGRASIGRGLRTAAQQQRQRPIVQGDLSPCPPGFRAVRSPLLGRLQCVPIDTGDPFAPQEPSTAVVTPEQAAACPVCPPSCTLATGRRGKLNKTGYFLTAPENFGTYVPPGSKCVTPRRKNYSNFKASMNAVRRVEGSVRHHRRLEKALKKAAGRTARRRTA